MGTLVRAPCQNKKSREPSSQDFWQGHKWLAQRRLCVFRGKTRSPLRIPIRKQKTTEWWSFVLAGAQRLELWTRGFGDREKSPKNRINTRFFWKWHIFWHIETEENEALPCFACAFYCDLRYTYEQGNSICDSEGAENNAILQRGLYVRGRSAQPRDFSRV